MLTLRQLRYFEAVARLGHFGQAADHCAVTQPALSMQIKQLEEELGLVLIERRSRGIQLTAEGAEVLNRARRILAEAQETFPNTHVADDLDLVRIQRGKPMKISNCREH